MFLSRLVCPTDLVHWDVQYNIHTTYEHSLHLRSAQTYQPREQKLARNSGGVYGAFHKTVVSQNGWFINGWFGLITSMGPIYIYKSRLHVVVCLRKGFTRPKRVNFLEKMMKQLIWGCPFGKKTWFSTTTYIYKAPQPSFCFAMGEHAEEWCQLRGSEHGAMMQLELSSWCDFYGCLWKWGILKMAILS
jgi:hypothetical protein